MSSLKNLYLKHHTKLNAVVMGNGPSLNNYDFDLIKKNYKDDTIFLACNRISNLFHENNMSWRPDIYTCFTSESLISKDWQNSIDRCLQDNTIYSFVFDNYRKVTKLESFHENIFFCKEVLEHSRHEKVKNNFIDVPLELGFLKSYSATVTLFQICNWLNVKNIFLIGQDGYTKKRGDNHFSKTYNFEPGSFENSNNRILSVHRELKDYFIKKNVAIFNASNNSILNEIYEYKSLNSL